MASTLEHAYSSPDGSAERLAPPPGASRASRASLASSPPSILARVSLEGFLYKQQGAHPMHSPQSTRGFLGLAGRFWCVIRSDVDVFAAYTKYQDTLVVNGHAAAFHCTDMTVEEPQDEPSCFVLRGKDLRGAEQTLELYAADEAERQGWAKELRRHGARRYVAPPPVDTMTQLREATARKAKEAAAGVKEAATDTAAALRWAGESAAVTLGAKSPTAEEQKDHLMTLKQQRAEKRDGQVTTFTTTPPKSYRPAAVVDRMLADWTERALEGIGVYVFNSLKDPWLGTVKARPWFMPKWMMRAIDAAHDTMWEDFEHELKDVVLSSIAFGDKETRLYNEMRLKHWATDFPTLVCEQSGRPRPWSWLRARVLYAIFPADQSMWMSYSSPLTVFTTLLAMTPTLGANIYFFLLIFLMIDRRDEYMLVQFILYFKAFQFLTGLFAAVNSAYLLFQCVDVPGMCAATAPGEDAWFKYTIAAEPLRVAIVWYAFALLWCGCARGSREEIIALETVRVDAADGTLDGERDVAALRRAERKGEMGKASSGIDATKVSKAAEAARSRFDAPTRYGGYLGHFMVYDLCAYVFSSALLGLKIWYAGYTPDDWMFWLCLYYLKALVALLALPFLAFGVPVLGTILTLCKPTGYDRNGILCPALNASQIARKMTIERDMKHRSAARAHRSGLAKKIDAMKTRVRGRKKAMV